MQTETLPVFLLVKPSVDRHTMLPYTLWLLWSGAFQERNPYIEMKRGLTCGAIGGGGAGHSWLLDCCLLSSVAVMMTHQKRDRRRGSSLDPVRIRLSRSPPCRRRRAGL